MQNSEILQIELSLRSAYVTSSCKKKYVDPSGLRGVYHELHISLHLQMLIAWQIVIAEHPHLGQWYGVHVVILEFWATGQLPHHEHKGAKCSEVHRE